MALNCFRCRKSAAKLCNLCRKTKFRCVIGKPKSMQLWALTTLNRSIVKGTVTTTTNTTNSCNTLAQFSCEPFCNYKTGGNLKNMHQVYL